MAYVTAANFNHKPLQLTTGPFAPVPTAWRFRGDKDPEKCECRYFTVIVPPPGAPNHAALKARLFRKGKLTAHHPSCPLVAPRAGPSVYLGGPEVIPPPQAQKVEPATPTAVKGEGIPLWVWAAAAWWVLR